MTTLGINSKLQNGKYVIREVLGQGSFGITYRATTVLSVSGDLGSLATEVNVAVKEFFMEDVNRRVEGNSSVDGTDNPLAHDYRIRFRKEAEHLATLNHNGIVHVAGVFDENNTTYYVMEYVDGESLDNYIVRNGKLGEGEAWEIIKQVGGALDHMHKCRMLHLDVKPKNIMRRKDGRIVLIDFGLSKVFDASGAPMTGTTVGLGTPGYAPIEQNSLRRGSPFPATMDVYALGATFFKMLTGQTPPIASYILENGLPVDQLRAADVSEATISVLTKAMDPQWTQRYHTVAEMISECPDLSSSTNPFVSQNKQDIQSPVVSTGDATVPVRNAGPLSDRNNKLGLEATIPYAVQNRPREVERPDRAVELSLVNRLEGALSYRFLLSVDDESSVVVSRDGKNLLSKKWRGGIAEEVWQQLSAEGFFSPVHWENETDKPQPNPVDVTCVFHYRDGRTFVRAIPYAGGAIEGLLQHAVENVVNNTKLREYIDEAIRVGREGVPTGVPSSQTKMMKPVSKNYTTSNQPASNQNESQQSVKSKKKKSKLWLIPVIIGSAAVVGLAVWLLVSRGESVNVGGFTSTTEEKPAKTEEQIEFTPVDYSTLKNVTKKRIKDEDGVTTFTYSGTVDQSGRPHGKGIAEYGRDDVYGRVKYNGEFYEGKCHGKGSMDYVNGNCFMGTFYNGHIKSGNLYVATSNQSFLGTFQDDKPFNGYWVDENKRHLSQVTKGKEKQL